MYSPIVVTELRSILVRAALEPIYINNNNYKSFPTLKTTEFDPNHHNQRLFHSKALSYNITWFKRDK